MLNFDDDKPNRDDDPYDRFASVTHKTVAKRSRNRRVWPPYLLKQTYSHFSAHWPSQSQLSSGLNDQPITVSVPCNEIRYNVTKYDTDLALPFRGCQSSQKNRKNIVKIPPSTTPTRATSPMSLGPRNVTPRSRDQQTVCSRPPTRQKWRSNTSFAAVACNLGMHHRSAPSTHATGPETQGQ